MKCHMCESETEWYCRDCDQPVCEDCVVQMTYHNQIDYTLCQDCHETAEAKEYLHRSRQWKKDAEVQAKKEVRNKARRAAYWKPEAVEKRQIAKELKRREQAELYRRRMAETIKTVADMFRGMF